MAVVVGASGTGTEWKSDRSGLPTGTSDPNSASAGDMYFNTTLNDWTRFDITKRTKFDATISSGLAVMSCNRHLYAPNAKIEKPQISLNISKYNQKGNMSRIIKN